MVAKDNLFRMLLLITAMLPERLATINKSQARSNGLRGLPPSDGSGHLRNPEASSTQMRIASRFFYTVRGEADHFREEHRDENGVVRGSYGYRTPTGIMRLVRYVADENGFRAGISSNEPGVSVPEPSSVRLHKFPTPQQRIQPNRIRNPSSRLSWPPRNHLAETNLRDKIPPGYLENTNRNAFKNDPVFSGELRRNNIKKRRQELDKEVEPLAIAVTRNTFASDVNHKDVEYRRYSAQNLEPKIHISRTTPIKLTTPASVPFDSKRLSFGKETPISKKSNDPISVGDSTDTFANSNEQFVQVASRNTMNPVDVKKMTTEEASRKCGKPFACNSRLAASIHSGFDNNSAKASSGIDSNPINEKISAAHGALRSYLSTDNVTLPQVVFAKKLLQLYDLDGIVPPHLLPNSISVVSYPKRNDAEVKELLGQIAESRWKSKQDQQRIQKPWARPNNFRDTYKTESSPESQFAKRPFIQLLSPLSVDVPDLPYLPSNPFTTRNPPIESHNTNIQVNHQYGEEAHYISKNQENRFAVQAQSDPQPHTSESTGSSNDRNSLKSFVLRHFLLGSLASNDDLHKKGNDSLQNSMTDDGKRSSSVNNMQSTRNETLEVHANSVDSPEVEPSFTKQKNVGTLPEGITLTEEINRNPEVLTENSDVWCAEHPKDCLQHEPKAESETTTDSTVDFISNSNRKRYTTSKSSLPSEEQSNIKYSEESVDKFPWNPQLVTPLPQYWQDHPFLDRGKFGQQVNHRLFKITRPERPLYDSRGQIVKPDAVPLHLHRFMLVKSSSPSSLGPLRFSIPRPVPPSSVIIPPKPPTVF